MSPTVPNTKPVENEASWAKDADDSELKLEYLEDGLFELKEPKSQIESRCADEDCEFKENINEFFDDLDKNNDGVLEFDEFCSGFRKGVYKKSTRELRKVFRMLDKDKNGVIDRKEFLSYALSQRRRLLDIFKGLQRTGRTGSLTFNDVKQRINSLGLTASDADIMQLLDSLSDPAELDLNQDVFRQFFSRTFLLSQAIFEEYEQPVDLGEDSKIPKSSSWSYMWGDKLIVFCAGAISGAISRTATAPADRLKVLMQSGMNDGKGVWQLTQSIMQENGAKAFYRGNFTNVVKIAPESATKFFVFESVQPWICSNPAAPTMAERFTCGAIAGFMAQSVVYPLEIVKTRLAVAETGRYRGIADCFMQTLSREGWPGMYRGWGTSVMGIIPYAGVDLAMYTKLKDVWAQRNPGKEPSSLTILGTGALASICGQIVAYPLQVLRTKLQVQGLQTVQAGKIPGVNGQIVIRPPGPAAIALDILRTKGPLGFYTGISCNFMKSVPAISITYLCFERSKEFLRSCIGT